MKYERIFVVLLTLMFLLSFNANAMSFGMDSEGSIVSNDSNEKVDVSVKIGMEHNNSKNSMSEEHKFEWNHTSNGSVKVKEKHEFENKFENKIGNEVFMNKSFKSHFFTINNKKVKVEMRRENNFFEVKINNSVLKSEFEIRPFENNGRMMFKVKLNNSKEVEVKVLPEDVMNKVKSRIRIKANDSNVSLELKEKKVGNEEKLVYEVKTKKEARILGLFKTEIEVEAEVDAENGEVLDVKKPWWSFLTFE